MGAVTLRGVHVPRRSSRGRAAEIKGMSHKEWERRGIFSLQNIKGEGGMRAAFKCFFIYLRERDCMGGEGVDKEGERRILQTPC